VDGPIDLLRFFLSSLCVPPQLLEALECNLQPSMANISLPINPSREIKLVI
jgi:hypothetical protein